MTAQELVEAGERLFGQHWRQPLATALRVDISTLRRWASGKDEVPGPAALAVRLLVEKLG